MSSEAKELAESNNPTAEASERLSTEEMLGQLQVMARQIAGDAPPALREASVVAAELAAIAARGTGPIAHTLADVTDDASLRLAERLEAYAASVREADAIEANVSGGDDAESVSADTIKPDAADSV
jgi:hypothetical protein